VGDLITVSTKLLPDGAQCWVTSNQSLYFWRAYTALAPNPPDVVKPADVALSEPGRWVRQITPYQGNFAVQTFAGALTSDFTVDSSNPFTVTVEVPAAVRGPGDPLIFVRGILTLTIDANSPPGTLNILLQRTTPGPATMLTGDLVVGVAGNDIGYASPFFSVFTNDTNDWTFDVVLSTTTQIDVKYLGLDMTVYRLIA